MNAAVFGLYAFWSEDVVAENDELLGAEEYCCVRRSPSLEEFQLIERASCLAAKAIQSQNEAGGHDKSCIYGDLPVQARVLEWPASKQLFKRANSYLSRKSANVSFGRAI